MPLSSIGMKNISLIDSNIVFSHLSKILPFIKNLGARSYFRSIFDDHLSYLMITSVLLYACIGSEVD